MNLFRRRLLFGLIPALLLGSALIEAPAWAQGPYKVETAPAPAVPDVPQTLLSQLDTQGARVVDGKGAAICEVWTLKSVDLPGGGGDIYSALGSGVLIGVIHYPAAITDFRGSALKPGYYTMRYGTMPQDGNHMGVNPYRDFLVLSPIAADTELGPISNFDNLMKLSEKATTTGHPAVLSLVPENGSDLPSVVQTSDGYTALQLKLSGKAGGQSKDLPIALVVVGQTTAQT